MPDSIELLTDKLGPPLIAGEYGPGQMAYGRLPPKHCGGHQTLIGFRRSHMISGTFTTQKKSKKQAVPSQPALPNIKCKSAIHVLTKAVAKQAPDESNNNEKSGQYSSKIKYDKFYTKELVAIECLKALDLDVYDCVVEPSAGNGSFFKNIEHKNKIGLDIQPECSLIDECDWFAFAINPKYEKVLVVGNPPFGINNKLSIAFINHASSFANVQTIAFVLPNVFNKHTLQNKISADYRLKYLKELPPYSFEVNGVSHHIPCTFFVFDKSAGPDLRFSPGNYKDTKDFVFGTAKIEFDFFVMGAAPNTVKYSPAPTNRGYYIKVREGVDVESVKEKFRRGSWTGYSSVSGGVAWRTQAEIVCQYRKQFEDIN